ncbi:hypothetical protein SEA_JUMBO_83 [Gordonia phage Jumbo]|uniref:Uncharacterized protein n=1 Tax=Gordonia phage Jumbo TaxID=1887650 RepID=A0A1B3B0S1_9CAUD|nr:hypothetical protein BIZ69_gp083 [Gordonia phage Jumbo]AOE44591.1 hypothetical protein SEA_JUMBO_83 [Gordonia phage Jumbo]
MHNNDYDTGSIHGKKRKLPIVMEKNLIVRIQGYAPPNVRKIKERQRRWDSSREMFKPWSFVIEYDQRTGTLNNVKVLDSFGATRRVYHRHSRDRAMNIDYAPRWLYDCVMAWPNMQRLESLIETQSSSRKKLISYMENRGLPGKFPKITKGYRRATIKQLQDMIREVGRETYYGRIIEKTGRY